MRFPLHQDDRDEIRRFQLRSACRDCFFHVQDEGQGQSRCAHEWPSEEQERWPLVGEEGSEPAGEISLCKEFELR